MSKIVIILLFILLIFLSICSYLNLWKVNKNPEISVEGNATKGKTLFIYIPASFVGIKDRGWLRNLLTLGTNHDNWTEVKSTLESKGSDDEYYGSAVRIRYPVAAFSNASPDAISQKIAEEIDKLENDVTNIILVGESLGALLVKRAFLKAENGGKTWTNKVRRVVLAAGMNRGWDISGHKPADLGWLKHFRMWFGTWISRLFGFGKLIHSAESGAPFVANLRMDWIERMNNDSKRPIEVVQLLGDIDDLVSEDDNTDLNSAGKERFSWLKVRGTGHENIVDFSDTTPAAHESMTNRTMGSYRKSKFQLATKRKQFADLLQVNEVHPLQPDNAVSHIVFVIHGIRDLGEWAAAFEMELRKQFEEIERQSPSDSKLAVVSSRYGYFGMGPFLLKPVREKYVKWLMDEITEALAKYPNADQVHFIGHSNGSYLIAEALQRYPSLRKKLGRIVFGGSVVRKEFKWDEILSSPNKQSEPTTKLMNYVANDDWVVALFPRFFEPAWAHLIFKNNIGSAGFNGFDEDTGVEGSLVRNVQNLTGGHSAFLKKIPQTVTFLFSDPDDFQFYAASKDTKDASESSLISRTLKQASSWATWPLIWLPLSMLVIFVGWHFVSSSAEPRLPIFFLYIGLLALVLRHA